MRFFALASAALALAALSAPADARSRRHYDAPPPEAYSPFAPVNGAPQYCQRWCARDFSPCDPANFKIADGRCNGNFFVR
jgi:hypothetical protein